MEHIILEELKGYDKAEALNKASIVDIVVRNAQQAWIGKGRPTVGTSAFTAFAYEYCLKHKLVPGMGAYITLEKPRRSRRRTPATIKDEKHVYGYGMTKRFAIKENDTEAVYILPVTTRAEAIRELKQHITKAQKDCSLIAIKTFPDDRNVIAKGEYTLSPDAKLGTYIVFKLVE